MSAALEQVAGDRLMYIWAGFACALVAVGFAVGEVLWMKQNKIRIGFLDLVGFLATILQILSFGMQVVYVYLHTAFPIKFITEQERQVTLHLLLFNQNLKSRAQLPIQQDPPTNTQDTGSATN